MSETALGAALMRADESLRRDRLFDDPYAAAFVAAAPPLFPDMPSVEDDPELAELEARFRADVVVRTCFYDECLFTAVGAGCRQVVLLGAGLDTRAFRLDWPRGVQIFELDLPEVFAFKEKVLTQQRAEPRCARTTIAVDFREDWPDRLTAAGFDPGARSTWTAEGLLAYLTHDDAERLLGAVSALSTSGSRLSMEHAEFDEDSILARARTLSTLVDVTVLWAGGMRENVTDWLHRHDWEVRAYDGSTLTRSSGRQFPDGTAAGLLTAVKLR